MTRRFARHSPAEAVEQAFFRIQQERMADVPILNDALSVESVDFQPWCGHWLGVVITPWCMNLVLVPGSGDGWESTGDNRRRFVRFPAGDFAFLGAVEPELGEYQTCSLFSPMGQFANQAEAVAAARVALSTLLTSPARGAANTPNDNDPVPVSRSRRRFLALGRG